MAETQIRPLRVFLCHASADKPAVRVLYKRLIADGIDAWLDEERLKPGQHWRDEIPIAIQEADIVIICLSNKSVTKEGFVQKEIRFALDFADEKPYRSIYIIPLLLEKINDAAIPPKLRERQYVSIYEQNGYKKLISALNFRASQQNINVTRDRSNRTFPFFAIGFLMMCIIATMVSAGSLIIYLLTNPEKTSATITKTPRQNPTKPLSTTSVSPNPVATTNSSNKDTPTPQEFTDSNNISMMFVPSGEFIMGSNNYESNEKPEHKVFVDEFYIDKYEVTYFLYSKCVASGYCEALKFGSDYWGPEYKDNPVVMIDWHTAEKFCEWRRMRLPTEAEWEKAARGTDGRIFPWGNSVGEPCMFGNFDNCASDISSVGVFENDKSPYHVYDLAGNVQEWVYSLYAPYPYEKDDGRENENSKGVRVIRGGNIYSTVSPSNFVRTTQRITQLPNYMDGLTGFRCATTTSP